uniref:N-alpha-acetyltransferase 40 n=1 Tax=Calcidiscus leptoporus TaxID=127549 RepID=A0A7S0P602_9EUKA|mmetsp:Transcript_58851/g.134996  ORF Transcript_58851/g.134996 Transcript_58851/m.134996 type:complete len:268 (+) Transcript_58851:92-895(+)
MARNAVGIASPSLGRHLKGTSSRKKQARRERITRAKERAALVAVANSQTDLLSGLDAFRTYVCNELDVRVEAFSGPQLCESDIDACMSLLRSNMGTLYERSSWGWDEATKRAGLVDAATRVVLLRMQPTRPDLAACEDDWVIVEHPEHPPTPPPQRNVGFLHLSFTIEDERPVLYVLELQLEEEVREKGLGKFLMQLAEVLARKYGMEALMLTVFKTHKKALDFYRQKLRYAIDESSPSLWNHDADYEILSKPVEPQPQEITERTCS